MQMSREIARDNEKSGGCYEHSPDRDKGTVIPMSKDQFTSSARGSAGGKATFNKYGSQYMAEIGRRGFTAAMAKFDNNPYVLNKFIAGQRAWPQRETTYGWYGK